jgi:hypothetical protein
VDPRPHAPGDGSEEPLLNEGPLPPGSEIEELVDAIDQRIRRDGPEEVASADRRADTEQDPTDAGAEEAPDAAADQEPPD